MEDRIKALEAKVASLDARLMIEECRWQPKQNVWVVFVGDYEILGIYSAAAHAEAKIARSDKDKTYRIAEFLLDAG